jgi:hypothetical protein
MQGYSPVTVAPEDLASRGHGLWEGEVAQMSDTITSSLWLSLVDMLVVFAVLAFLMLISYGLKLFSRGTVDGDTSESDDGSGDVDVASGDEPAHEAPAKWHAPTQGQDPEELAAVATVVDLGATGTDGAPSARLSGTAPVQRTDRTPTIITITWRTPDDQHSSNPS